MALSLLEAVVMNNEVAKEEQVVVNASHCPSQVVAVPLTTPAGVIKVWIPQNEVFRIKNIFQDQEYAIADFRRGAGPVTVVDAGSNVGLFALYVCLSLPDAVVHCFEPAPVALELLEKNLADEERARIYPYGLSNVTKSIPFYVNRANTGLNSFKKGHNSNLERVIEAKIRHAGAVFDEIGLKTVDILKIDTEGSEVEILSALDRYLEYTHYILLEYHSEVDRRKIDELLNGFTLIASAAGRAGCGTVKYVNNRLAV